MELLDLMKNLSVKDSDKQEMFRSVAADIDNVPTEVVIAEFTNKALIIVTQYEKIGSLIAIERDQVHNSLGNDNVFTLKVIFGDTGEEQQVAARYLAESLNIVKPMFIFLCLKSYDIETLKACKDIIIDLKAE